MRLFRPCFFVPWIYPDALFRINTSGENILLTFDDGPDPGSTPAILNVLGEYNIKALFFCSGREAENNPQLIELIRSKGHKIGNHGYNHLDGWETASSDYIKDVERAAEFTSSVFFRPPYGRIRLTQYLKLKRKYKIVFWDLMPYDFDKSFGEERSLKVLIEKIRPGSIIILHDRPDSTLIKNLGSLIVKVQALGYSFVPA